VNVEEFQLHLSNLSKLLRRAGGKKVADDLEDVCAGLQPYRERRLKDLLGMIAEAEAVIRNGPPGPKPAGRSRKKANPDEVAQAINRVRDLYNRATDPAVSREDIDTACKQLGDLDAAKPSLEALAREFFITEKLKNKSIAIEKIRQAILIRKGTYQRSQV
jgi:hypothetical protein